MPDFISKEQNGFMRDRSIIDSILNVEAAMISTSVWARRGAGLFFDFTAASPSLSHRCFWEGLETASIPTHITLAIQGLYKGTSIG